MADEIEDSHIDYENSKYGNTNMDKTKQFSHEKWIQWEDSVYTYFSSRKNSSVFPLACVMRKYTADPADKDDKPTRGA